MSVTVNDFWKLSAASGLLSHDDCRRLQEQFARLKGSAGQANTATLAEWLIAGGVLTRYQAAVLAAGRPGPFVFGDFVLLERIERGRLARCFKAQYKGTQPATLLFAAAGADRPAPVRATAERLETARAIKSPHVARVYQFQATAHPAFFVIEPLEGQSMRERLARGRLELSEACRAGFEAALGLVAMHEQRAAQGNMTPDNVWVETSSTIKLLHYPLAEPLAGAARLDPSVADYLAPELNDPNRAADALSDIYGLGAMLYEWISGRPPFPGGSIEQKRARHASEVPARLDQLVPGVSEELADLIAEMLDKEVMLRAATASYVAHLLSPFTSQVAKRREALPPRSGPQAVAHGYGAWREPDWKPPPMPEAARPAAKDDVPEQSAAAPTKTTERAVNAGSPQPFVIVAEPAAGAAPLARRKRASQTTTLIVALAGAAATLLFVALVFLAWGERSATERAEIAPQKDEVSPTSASAPVADAAVDASQGAAAPISDAPRSANATGVVDDDGKTMWASPTAGEPIDVSYLPDGAQLIFALRASELFASDEGKRIFAALGPAAEAARTRLEETLGVELADVEQLVVAAAPGAGEGPRTAYVARLAGPVDEEALVKAWGAPSVKEHEGRRYFVGEAMAYHLAGDDGRRTLIAAPPETLVEILSRNGQPLLRQGLEALVRASDAARHVNLLLVPSFLFSDGWELVPAELAPLRLHMEELFGRQTQGVLASAHAGESLFLELRVLGSADVRAAQLAERLRGRLVDAGHQLERYVASLSPPEYGRLVIHRFPRMAQLAGNFTRAGAEDRQAVLRCYLPAAAAHNLALGAELVLQEGSPAAAGDGEVAAVDDAAAPIGAQEALDRVTTLAFPRDTLERSLELLSRDIGAPIVIEGPDLQLEGITRNQSFSLDQRDKPAREILSLILRLADPDGKLVYVVRAAEDGSESIHITTRAAAARRGETLGSDSSR